MFDFVMSWWMVEESISRMNIAGLAILCGLLTPLAQRISIFLRARLSRKHQE